MNIQTDRLLLRELVPEDWVQLREIALDFRKSKYAIYDMPLPVEYEETKSLAKQFAASHLFFAVCLKDTEKMIGYVCFHKDQESYDLGYCFHAKYHGNGYAFEGCKAALEFMQQNHRVKTLTAGTALKNTPSCKLLAKLGFTLTGTEMLSFHKDEKGNDILFEGGNFTMGE